MTKGLQGCVWTRKVTSWVGEMNVENIVQLQAPLRGQGLRGMEVLMLVPRYLV